MKFFTGLALAFITRSKTQGANVSSSGFYNDLLGKSRSFKRLNVEYRVG